MNRIIIVGNGFDLAHQLATRYEDFINWYWDDWGHSLATSMNRNLTDGLCSFRLKDNVLYAGWALVWREHYIPMQEYSLRNHVEYYKTATNLCDFKVDSLFFTEICKAVEEKGWVDIEAEYYRMLNSVYLSSPKKLNELAAKFGISVLNSPGTIDADYRGEIKVILVNLSNESFVINPGERIAQMVVARYEKVEWDQVEVLDQTERGEGGFGSTGR